MKSGDLFTLLWHSIRKEPQAQRTEVIVREDPIVELRQIKGLLDQGLISKSDYKAKKGEILAG